MTTYLPWLAIGVGVVLLVARRLWVVVQPKSGGSAAIKMTASGASKDQVRNAFDLLYDAFPTLRETLDKVAPIIWKYRVPPQPAS